MGQVFEFRMAKNSITINVHDFRDRASSNKWRVSPGWYYQMKEDMSGTMHGPYARLDRLVEAVENDRK